MLRARAGGPYSGEAREDGILTDVSTRSAQQALGVVAAFAAWTFAAVSAAGVIVMSAGHSRSGEWPVGATIALILIVLGWIAVAVIVRRRQRRASRSAGQLPTEWLRPPPE